ncbi:MAG TPA: thioredoxin fold domain-containing protein [Thermodesulfobacteriota bacterium]|nr:thioredoxin fold domain-containing protein [Thermodesulfobacteriota bacterium]
MRELNWRKSLEVVSGEISGGTRLPLLVFYRGKECDGSRKTLGEVFKVQNVINTIERESAPVKYDILESKEIAERYHVDWTPTFIFTDENGRELERWVGYLPAEDFIAQFTLSKGLAAFHLARYIEAEREFEMLVEEYPDSELVPEAEYYLGVSRFKEKGDAYPLGEICHLLQEKYPDSMWTKKCSIWSHLTSESRKRFVAFDQGGSTGSGAY